MNLKQNTIHTASIPWTINVTTTGHDLVCYQPHNSDLLINVSNRTRSMNFQRHFTGRDLICYVNQTIVMYWTMPLLNSYVSTKAKLLYTVIKAEFWFWSNFNSLYVTQTSFITYKQNICFISKPWLFWYFLSPPPPSFLPCCLPIGFYMFSLFYPMFFSFIRLVTIKSWVQQQIDPSTIEL